jgi:plastocyanin
MKDGPVSGVPLTIKIFNNEVIGIWVGPDKVSAHFGNNSPIYGTLSAHSKEMLKAEATSEKGSPMASADHDKDAAQSSAATTTTPATNNNNTASTTNATSAAAGQTNIPVKMSAKEVDEVYRWSTSDGVNPTLQMSANTNNVMQIDNPTDAKHEFVVESSGKEVATSGDIAPNGSGQLSFHPSAPGVYEYHCEYHPTTMKGTIQVK